MAEPIAFVWKVDPVGDHSRDLQLVIRRLFRAVQDIETSIRERLSYRCSRQPIGDARRTSHAEPFSLDAGAPEITSIAVERWRSVATFRVAQRRTWRWLSIPIPVSHPS